MKNTKENNKKQRQAEREELQKLAKAMKRLMQTIPWDTKNADILHEVMVSAGKIVDKYRQDPCFS